MQHEVARGASIQVASFIDNVELQLGTVLEDIGVAHHDENDHIHTHLSRLLGQHDVYEELALINDRGQEVERISRLTPAANIVLGYRSVADEFVVPMASGEVYYSPVWFDQNNGEPFMTLAVPLIDMRRAVTDSVLGAHIRLKKAWDLIAILIPSQKGLFEMNPGVRRGLEGRRPRDAGCWPHRTICRAQDKRLSRCGTRSVAQSTRWKLWSGALMRPRPQVPSRPPAEPCSPSPPGVHGPSA